MYISPIAPSFKQNIYKNNSHATKKQNINFASRMESRSSAIVPPFYLYNIQGIQTHTVETYDSFTGLRDKKSLIYALDEIMTETRNADKEFSVAMFDMDNFKSVNELLGYTTGDEFIKAISNDINAITSANGVKAYRFGGEEFVVIFDNQSMEMADGIVQSILTRVGSNPIIQSRSAQYRKNAEERLAEDYADYRKVSSIESLEAKKELVEDLRRNLTTSEARNDPYFAKMLNDINSELNEIYLRLIDERIENESNNSTIDKLINIRKKIKQGEKPTKEEQQNLKEYLQSIYDKTYEIHRIKKWLSDFDNNDGFSITGGVTRYNKYALKDKTPIDVISEVGEVLKKGKRYEKGRGYSRV